ncbi:MAG: sulfatase [Alloprevotella sp.]
MLSLPMIDFHRAAIALPLCFLPQMVDAKSAAPEAQRPPNILLFLVDDMGWQDTSVPFWDTPTHLNRRYHTPNMERLAVQGMMFTQAYASAISSPSRCSLLTGSNAARHRVTNWTLHRDRSTDNPHPTVTPPDWNVNGIAQTAGTPRTYVATSFVQLLHDAGYHTIHCGKAHWGSIGTPGADPGHFGFDVNIAGHAAGGLATYYSERNYGHDAEGKATSPMAVPGLEKYWQTGTFVTEALTREAIAALDSAKTLDRPFFLHMAHYAIHVPIDPDPRYLDRYLREGLSEKEAAYATLIEGMDKSLGDLMQWLEENGEAERTVVLFMSDNGGYATGTQWRDAPLYVQNFPLRCGKGSAYEGGIREPLIVSWPGVTPAGSRQSEPVIIEDFYPTILDMAGIAMPKRIPQVVDGKSFVPLLSGGKGKRARTLVWNCPNVWDNSGPGIGPSCTVRQGKWKMIYFYDDGHHELYNLADDIGEAHDLSAEYPEKVRQLSKVLGKRLRKMQAQRPTFSASGRPCLWPDDVWNKE